jgi:hypothetical protein
VIGLVCGAVVGAAIASPLSRPVLRSPRNGGNVRSGRVTLIVKDPGVPKAVRPVYVTISNKRKLDKYGHLAVRFHCNGRCDFLALHPWRGHRGYWIVHAPRGFTPWWSVTPGKYYWQAVHTAPLCQAKGCTVASAIHWFRVVR